MPTRERTPIGAPCWVDLMTSDVDGARAFYTRVFGWTAEDPNPEFGGYFSFLNDGVPVAGCMTNMAGEGVPDLWEVYLATDDVEATTARATEHGGQEIVAPTQVGDLGKMAMILDAGGAPIGIWQPLAFPGLTLYDEPGAPRWFELNTKSYDGAADFYREVFGWTTEVMSDTPEFRYTVAVNNGENLAGIMDASGFLPPEVPSHWGIYFGVPDADATLASIVDLGGSVIMPANDTPYGRLAAVTDPTGASFRVMQSL
jgi:predicted enzyme related to lactoylglutathione lyase